MTRTTTGNNSGGGTFRVDDAVREIGLTQRGIFSPEELLCRDFDYPALLLTDRTC
jgi:hypothetical protein